MIVSTSLYVIKLPNQKLHDIKQGYTSSYTFYAISTNVASVVTPQLLSFVDIST